MKIRTDFITNSSSSCFIVNLRNNQTKEEVIEKINKIIRKYKKIGKNNFDPYRYYLETDTKEPEILSEIFSSLCWYGDSCINYSCKHNNWCDKENYGWSKDQDDIPRYCKFYEEGKCLSSIDLVQKGDFALFFTENIISYETREEIEDKIDCIHLFLG